jgi:hypothetical protein
MERLPSITSALAVAAALASGCGDEPLAPTADTVVPLAATTQEREQVRSALAFASQQSALAFRGSDASASIAASFAALIRGIARNDRRTVEAGLATARAAVAHYGETAGARQADPDLEALTLTLDRVAAVATPAQDPQP